MWTGTASSIPNGWALCDGTNGTPDLRNRFIIGASNEYPVNQQGGTNDHAHTVTVNGHRLTTAQLPWHQHTNTCAVMSRNRNSQWGVVFSYNHVPAPTASHKEKAVFTANATEYVGKNEPHSHVAAVDSATNMPPFYALCFIKKVV